MHGLLLWYAGADQGYFDLEALQLLAQINKNPDRQMLYDQVRSNRA